MIILDALNLNQNELQLAVLQNLAAASPPSTPVEGQVWYDSTNKIAKLYRNAAWHDWGQIDSITDSGGGKITVGGSNGSITLTVAEANLTHNSLGGLTSGDPHTQYIKADGTRALTGKQSYSSALSFVAGSNEIPSVKFVEDKIASLVGGTDWQNAVITRWDASSALPTSPAVGDRYLCKVAGNGWTINYIYQCITAGSWVGATATAPLTGMAVEVLDESTGVYMYTGSAWTFKSWEATTASNGVKKVTNDIQADHNSLTAASGGVDITADSVAIVDASATNATTKDTWASVVSAITGTGLVQDGTTKKIGVKPDITTGATVVAVNVVANGVGVLIDNATITKSGQTLSAATATTSQAGVLPVATQAETEAKSVTKIVTPADLTNFPIKKSFDITGDNTNTVFTLTHNLNTRDVTIEVYQNNISGSYERVYPKINHATVNTTVITITPKPPVGQNYRVVIIG